MKKIILLGYMGSGKTTVGKLLAESLDISFHDLDELIENRLKISIPQIFEEKGEIFFRKKESEILEEFLTSQTNFVLAAGGGTPCYGNNLEQMLLNATDVVYLQYTVPVLVDRLRTERDKRPLIRPIQDEDLMEFVGKHLLERSPFYHQASVVINPGTKLPQQIVEEITLQLR